MVLFVFPFYPMCNVFNHSYQNAMTVMSFTEEEITDVFQIIAGVLQLGNVNFMAAGGAQIAEKSGKNLYAQKQPL